MKEPILYLYVKQDGMYNTKDLLITDEYKSQDDLPPYWFPTDGVMYGFMELVWYAYNTFFDSDFRYIRYDAEDKYIITESMIKVLFAEELI